MPDKETPVTVTDEERSDLHQYLKESMGEKDGNALMALLPPMGWADLATKHDLASLRTDVQAEFADVRAEMRTGFADLRTELHKTLLSHMLFLVGTNITFFGIALAAVRFG